MADGCCGEGEGQGRAKGLLRVNQGLIACVASLGGIQVGGIVNYVLQRQQFAQQLTVLRASNKTEFVAEETARHFLMHKGYVHRSFVTLQQHIGGFDDDELRRLLVRAGAIRVFRDDGTEWWGLLERTDEFLRRKGVVRSTCAGAGKLLQAWPVSAV